MESNLSTGITSKLHSKDISSISLIFRNLLILEDDLRQQYKRNLVMKLGYQFFIYSLSGTLIYLIFFSQYGTGIYIRLLELFISITLILFRFSGEEYLNKNLQFRIFLRNSNSVLKDYNLQLVIITKTYSHLKAKTNSKRLQLIFKTLMVVFIMLESIIDRLLKSLLLLKYKNQDINTKERVNYLEYKLTYWKIMLQTNFLPNENQIRKLAELETEGNIVDYDSFCNTYDIKLILDSNNFKVSTINTWQKYRLEFWNRERIRRLNRLDELYKNEIK
ncbi:Nem1-Spo7 phosphatase regulatory subunit [Hanseniaspora uvarum]|nr:Nem1-Spo7 phosphatase regulatory subunit [Hanseniaspora uvarum]